MADRELQTILNSGGINTIFLGGATSGDALIKKSVLDTTYVNLAGSAAATKMLFDPQLTPPTYTEAQIYYDDVRKTFTAQGPFSDAFVNIGHDTHTHVINNSGVLINKGEAVRHDGVDGSGRVQIVKALADTFENAEIFGVAAHDIADAAEGAITTFGEIYDLDTSAYTAGVPLFLSDTVAGTFTETAPDIASRVGGVTVSNASTGKLFVAIINNTNIPTVFGGVQGQTTPTYALTTTAQDIVTYTSSKELITTVNATTGIITVPNDGQYRAHISAATSFTSTITTRYITIELYDVTGTAILFSYVKNIPRDATLDSLSFSWPVDTLAGNQYKLRIKANVSMNITLDSISFDLESLNIR